MARSRNFQDSRRKEKTWSRCDPVGRAARRQKLDAAISREEIDLEPMIVPRPERRLKLGRKKSPIVVRNGNSIVLIEFVDRAACACLLRA